MSTHLSRFILLLFGVCALVGPAGCGSPVKTEVSGTIKVRGQSPKYTGIQVMFLHPDGAQVSASVAEDGTYKAQGVPSGEVKVCFAYVSPEAAQQGAEFKASGGGRLKKPGDDKGAGSTPKVKAPGTPGPATNPIPLALRDTTTSNLTFKVEAGKPNTFDYDITP